MLVQRKVAQVVWGAAGGKPNDFEKFWPVKNTGGVKKMNEEEYREWYSKIRKKLKLPDASKN